MSVGACTLVFAVCVCVCVCVCVWVEVRRERRIEEQMCAVLWWCSWTDGDQVQPLSPRHLSPLACIQPPRASPPLHLLLPPLLGGKAEMCVCVCVFVCVSVEEGAALA